MDAKNNQHLAVFTYPLMGSALSVAAGLAFLWLCMLLPLVGKAGVDTPFAAQNFRAFLFYLLLTLLLCGLAMASKWLRRRIDGSPPPVFTTGLAGVCCLLLVALLTGLLGI